MAKKTSSTGDPKSLPQLCVPQRQAQEKIENRITSGTIMLEQLDSASVVYTIAETEYFAWDNYNYDLLLQLFTNSYYADQYRGYSFGGPGANSPEQQRWKWLKKEYQYKTQQLQSIAERIELITQMNTVNTVSELKRRTQKVFIVHGHDEHSRETAARLLGAIGYQPVILHEQPNQGHTIIEKLEENTDVDFAVILLTPDDRGHPKDLPNEGHPRARQNVILEMGFLMAKLGRKRVCCLYGDGVELPSDANGIVYVSLDAGGAWRYRLAKEMKAAGLQVDLNKIE